MGRTVSLYRYLVARPAVFLALAGAFGAALLPAVSPAAQPGVAHRGFVVERSDAQVLRLSLQVPEPAWSPVVGPEGATRFELALPGFNTAGGPGAARVPGLSSWIVVPPGTTPVLKILSETWTDAGGRPLVVEPVPVLRPGAGEEPGSVAEILVLPGETLPAEAPVPQGARDAFEKAGAELRPAGLQLGEVAWWRGRRIVSVSLNAARVDLQARAQSVLQRGEWEIRFEPAAQKSRPAGMQALKRTARGDDQFTAGFLNGEMLRSQPTEAAVAPFESPAKAAPRKAKGTLLAPEVRLPVLDSRMTVIDYQTLRDQGLIPDGEFLEDEVRIYQRRYLSRLTEADPEALPYVELEVPIRMIGEGDAFDGDDYFVFQALHLRDDLEFDADLGQGIETIPGAGDPHQQANKYNWYWLALSEPDPGESWARMETTSLGAASTTPLRNYRRTDHHENQVAFRANPPFQHVDRIWANHYQDSEVTVGLGPIFPPDPDGMEALLQVPIAGYNQVDRNLRLDLEIDGLDGYPLEEYTIDDDVTVVRSFWLDPSRIAGRSGVVRMQERMMTGARMYAMLNYAELTYDALYETWLDRLKFNAGSESGARPIEVTGFTASDLWLFDITDPRQPVFIDLAAQNVLADGDTWTLSIEPVQSGQQREFFAATGAELLDLQNWVYYDSEIDDEPVDPRAAAGDAPDVIVVTHEDFRDPLQRWVDHRIARAGGDLEIHVVEVGDLYDYYSGGLRDEWAIKRFVDYSIARWGSWALLLVGDANENARMLQVQQAAIPFARDWVPTHYHVQTSNIDEPELMPSDKWFVCAEYGEYPWDDYPDILRLPWQMLQGRLPCNSEAELNAMIDKIIAMETPGQDQDWRRRAIFFADDAWSEEYGDNSNIYRYTSSELEFESSVRDSLAHYWESGSPAPMLPDTLYLSNWLVPHEAEEAREINEYQSYTLDVATPALMASLNAGGLVAYFQGHGNPYVMASEEWFVDREVYNRHDVRSLANRNRPWIYFGMGCHLADWAQNTVISATSLGEQSLSEKFLVRADAGAAASFASPGFEYITHNAVYSEYIFRRWMLYPPGGGTAGSVAPAGRSRWMLGEILWATDAELLARRGNEWSYAEMVSQYALLGDPLMVMDGGEPVITGQLLGDPDQDLADAPVELRALDATNLRTVTLHAVDEAGIARLEVYDSREGIDRAGQWATETLPEGATDYRIVDYRLDLPIRPYRHSLVVEVYDTGAAVPGDRVWQRQFDVGMDAEFSFEGAVIDTADFEFVAGEPVHLQGNVTSGCWLDSSMEMRLESDNLTLSNVLFEVEKSNEIVVYFTAVAEDEGDVTRSVDLIIDGYTTTLTIEGVDPAQAFASVEKVYNFPNPVADGTDIVFEAAATASKGRIRIFSVSGRQVASLEVAPTHLKGGNRWCVPWNARDAEGDRLANGTYLYRVEMQTPDGEIVSDVQRMVMMR